MIGRSSLSGLGVDGELILLLVGVIAGVDGIFDRSMVGLVRWLE